MKIIIIIPAILKEDKYIVLIFTYNVCVPYVLYFTAYMQLYVYNLPVGLMI